MALHGIAWHCMALHGISQIGLSRIGLSSMSDFDNEVSNIIADEALRVSFTKNSLKLRENFLHSSPSTDKTFIIVLL
jgi:hypothetical protein